MELDRVLVDRSLGGKEQGGGRLFCERSCHDLFYRDQIKPCSQLCTAITDVMHSHHWERSRCSSNACRNKINSFMQRYTAASKQKRAEWFWIGAHPMQEDNIRDGEPQMLAQCTLILGITIS